MRRHLRSVRTTLPPVSCQFLRRIPDGANRQLETGAGSRWWMMECTAEQRSGSFMVIRYEGGKSLAWNQIYIALRPYDVGTMSTVLAGRTASTYRNKRC